jgi:Ca2+-binding EF-hand superfamily protein
MSRRQADGDRSELLDWQMDEIREAFNLFDADATGQISYFELKAAMKSLDFTPKRSELSALVQAADPSGSGYVDFDGFLKIMKKHASAVDVHSELDKIFALLTSGGSNAITVNNLRDVARELGENMTDDELCKMIELVGSGGRGGGAISRDAFTRIMIPKRGDEDLDLVDD